MIKTSVTLIQSLPPLSSCQQTLSFWDQCHKKMGFPISKVTPRYIPSSIAVRDHCMRGNPTQLQKRLSKTCRFCKSTQQSVAGQAQALESWICLTETHRGSNHHAVQYSRVGSQQLQISTVLHRLDGHTPEQEQVTQVTLIWQHTTC